MNKEDCKCPICGQEAKVDRITQSKNNKFLEKESYCIFECDICGMFYTKYLYENDLEHEKIDFGCNKNQLAFYMAHHTALSTNNRKYMFVINNKELYEKLVLERQGIKRNNPAFQYQRSLKYVDPLELENWCPTTFKERMNTILLYFYENQQYIGVSVLVSKEKLESLILAERYFVDTISNERLWIEQKTEDISKSVEYILNYIKSKNYISVSCFDEDTYEVQLTPEGLSKIDDIQEHREANKKIFVAMKFGEETTDLREAIRKGIRLAGYSEVIVDEIEHNNYIPPEILHQIRECQIMIAELSYNNGGVYFEEGYAMGRGKEVIQLCKRTEDNESKLHFDVLQKNTIFWEDLSEIPELLRKRIIATTNSMENRVKG